MEAVITQLFNAVFSEYGAFVAFLLLVNALQWKRGERKDTLIETKLVEIAENNAAVISDFTNELREQRRGNR